VKAEEHFLEARIAPQWVVDRVYFDSWHRAGMLQVGPLQPSEGFVPVIHANVGDDKRKRISLTATIQPF